MKRLREIVIFFGNMKFMMTQITDTCNANWAIDITNVMTCIWPKVPKLQAVIQEIYAILLKALSNLEIFEIK